MPDKRIIRPFATHYYAGANDKLAAVSSQGAASTEAGAVRAALVRCFLGQYAKALIVDRFTGVVVCNVHRAGHGFRLSLGSGVPFKTWTLKE